jgi:HlyD family secretion protein
MRVEEDGESPMVVFGSLADWPRRTSPACRLPTRLVSAIMLGAALICAVVMAVTSALGVSDGGSLIVSAFAQPQQQNPLEKARTAVENLIDRLRGRDMPEGIVKTNGRIEATQVDVAAKTPVGWRR